MHELNIVQYKSSAYHPQSQGAIKRFHQTLKNMLRCYCLEFEKDWDEGIHLLMFAARDSLQEALGFSPFELVFGHRVRGPLKMFKETWLSDTDDPPISLLEYVSTFRCRLTNACEIAQKNLKDSQKRMKVWYDRKAKQRSFNPGDQVLMLLPIAGHPLQARYHGPYVVERKVNDVDYVVCTPDRRKQQQLCHVNMLKAYHCKQLSNALQPTAIMVVASASSGEENEHVEERDTENLDVSMKLNNSLVLANLSKKLRHLPEIESVELEHLILEHSDIFPDVPSRTTIMNHDVDVGNTEPVKQHPFRVNPQKRAYLQQEMKYMLDNDLIEASQSPWSSPCILVPKPDKSYRFCTDFRKVNAVTKADSYPLPRIEDCIDRVSHSCYVSKFDLLKGYWQVPLTNRAKEISAFVTPDGLFQYKVMPFGMRNAPATFQRLINHIIRDVPNFEAYIDDVIIYSNSWEDHVKQIRKFFECLQAANLTINLSKSEFGHARVVFLGHVVGQGLVEPIAAKVEAIAHFPKPINKKELMRFLGMAGYYRRFCKNFSSIVEPMTKLLGKSQSFVWSNACQEAFEKIKGILMCKPVLMAPDFGRSFKLIVDASDIGTGAVLVQEDDNHIDHPICYYSKKFNASQRNYCTSEKELLGLILALQHFDIYVTAAEGPVIVFTDHNPLVYLKNLKNKNQRLLRWSLLLQQYCLEIKHIKGRDNVIADALSRAG